MHYPIHSTQDSYEKEFGYPKDAEVVHTPYNGEPFSAYTTIRKNGKSISIQFGSGGFYPLDAKEHIETTLK